MAGPRGAGRICPHCGLLGWSRRGLAGPGDCGERLGEEPGELRGGCGERSGTLRVGSRGPAESRQSPGGGQRKGRRLQESATCRPEDLTVPEFVCAAWKLARSLVYHVRHQQPRGGEEAAGEYAERLTGLVPGMQEEISACQGGKLRAMSGQGTVSVPGWSC